MLPLQLGEMRPVGIELKVVTVDRELRSADEFDLGELPFDVVRTSGGELLALPICPRGTVDAAGRSRPATVIALRRSVHKESPWVVEALIDAFEASRASAHRRLATITSPALALPWLTDQLAEDEHRSCGDLFVVGAATDRGVLAEAGAFAPEALAHTPVARSKAVEAAPINADPRRLRCRALRYVDRTLPFETVPEMGRFGIDYVAAPSLGGALPGLLAGELDLAEILLGDLVAELAERQDRIVGLPIFPARRFAQRYVWVEKDSPIESFADLADRRIGFPPGAATAAAWTRKLLEGSGATTTFDRGPLGGGLARILDRGVSGPTLQQQLADGALDALVTPYAIPPEDGGDRLRLLLADPAAQEKAQARSEGPPPISNVIAMRRETYEGDPSAARRVVEAFVEARGLGRLSLLADPPAVALAELGARVREAENLCGGDPYPYGVDANLASLAEFARHLHSVGAAKRAVEVDELFPPEV